MNRRLHLAAVLGLSILAPAAAFDHAALADPAMAVRDRPVAIDVLANDPGASARSIVHVFRKPAHGTALVQGQEIVYTPDPGYVGRDAFRYLVKTGRSVGQAEVVVDVVPAMLTLSGEITDGGGPATVSVVSGRLRFSGQSAVNGGYAVPMAGFDADMVRLQSRRGPVVLASVVGSMERLRDEAGADAVLTRGENAQVQVSRLSTALAYLLQVAGGGGAVPDDARLAEALAAVDTDVLLQMGAALGLAADGSHPMPAGVDDTLELVSDPEAYRAFVAEVHAADPDALPAAITALTTDPRVLPLATRDDFIAEWTLAASSAEGTIRVGIVHGERLVLEADGGGRYADTWPVPATGVSWSFVDGEARALMVPPRTAETFVFRDGVQVRTLYSVDQVDLVRLVDAGQGRPLVAVRRHQREVYPDIGEQRSYVGIGTRQAWRAGDGLPFEAAEFPGVHALPVHRPEILGAGLPDNPLTSSNYALHAFAADGSGVVDDGQAFDWALDGGRLTLAYADGELVELNRLQHDGRKGSGILADYLLPGGRSKAVHSLGSMRDGSLVFSPANLVGAWRSGFEISQSVHDAAPFDGFYLVLEPDGTGRQVSVSDEFGTSSIPLAWSLQDGAMVALTGEGQGRRERHWVPVSRAGDRIYVREELWRDPDAGGPQPPVLLSQRANFYALQAPPATAGRPPGSGRLGR